MRRSKTKENQVDKGTNSATDSKSVKLRRRKPLTDKTNNNVTTHNSATKKNKKTIESTTMKTIKAVVGVKTRSQATPARSLKVKSATRKAVGSPKVKSATRKVVGSTKVRTRKSVDKGKHNQGTKLSDSVVKHMKSARVKLTRTSNVKSQVKNSKKSSDTTHSDKVIEISDESLIIRQSARISIRKNKLVMKEPTPSHTFKVPLAKSPVKGRQSNPLAVYEFEFDPSEDPKPKRKRGQVKRYSSDSSGEEENSMKVVVKRLRKLDRKVKKVNEHEVKVSKKVKKVKVRAKPKPIEVKIKEMFEEIHDKKIKVKQNNLPEVVENVDASCCTVPEIHLEEFNTVKSTREEVAPEVIENVDASVPKVQLEQINTVKNTREAIEEVANSFLEDDSSDFDDFQPITPAPIHIISNVLVHKANADVAKPMEKIFNSTLLPKTAVPSSPWRLNVSTIRKKPHTFTVKDKSFIPSYDQDIVEISSKVTVGDKTSDSSGQNESEKVMNQTSILDFIKSSKPRPVVVKSVGLFDDVPVRSPRRVLGEINYLQSTPYKPVNSVRSYNSPNISMISDTEDSMFGFSFLSDSENVNDGNKENEARRKSPRKLKVDAQQKNIPTRISVNEIKRTLVKDVPKADNDNAEKVTEHPKTVRFDNPDISEAVENDLSVALFEDLEDSMKATKKIKQYVRKHPKRKRLPSIESHDSDNESDTELPNKKKTKRTKEEEEEIERLASFYNSMFEEIEQYPLCIE